jgi:hypothetical protein
MQETLKVDRVIHRVMNTGDNYTGVVRRVSGTPGGSPHQDVDNWEVLHIPVENSNHWIPGTTKQRAVREDDPLCTT